MVQSRVARGAASDMMVRLGGMRNGYCDHAQPHTMKLACAPTAMRAMRNERFQRAAVAISANTVVAHTRNRERQSEVSPRYTKGASRSASANVMAAVAATPPIAHSARIRKSSRRRSLCASTVRYVAASNANNASVSAPNRKRKGSQPRSYETLGKRTRCGNVHRYVARGNGADAHAKNDGCDTGSQLKTPFPTAPGADCRPRRKTET